MHSFTDSPSDEPAVVDVPPKYRQVEPRAAELFRELLSYWNLTALIQTLELSFESFDGIDPVEIVSRLNAVPGIDPQNIRFRSSDGSKSLFEIQTTRNFTEIVSGLGREFRDRFSVFSASANSIKLRATETKSTELTLIITDVSLSVLVQVESALQKLDGIQSLRRDSFTNRIGTFIIKTFKSPEALGLFLEESFPGLSVTSTTSTSLAVAYGR